MHRTTRQATRRRRAKRDGEQLPNGVDGTITGAPRPPVDLIEFSRRDAGEASRGGAVSGAARITASAIGAGNGQDVAIALSDGSRISFASVDTAGVPTDEHFRVVSKV